MHIKFLSGVDQGEKEEKYVLARASGMYVGNTIPTVSVRTAGLRSRNYPYLETTMSPDWIA